MIANDPILECSKRMGWGRGSFKKVIEMQTITKP
jgi:hypothetical protein